MSTRKRTFISTASGPTSKNDHDLAIQQPSSQRLRLESSSALTTTPLPSNLDQIEVQSLRAELEHERSLRALDKRRAEQHKKSLESRYKLAAEEAEQNRIALDELREETDQHIQQVRESRNDALMQLRECQMALEQAEEEAHLGSEMDIYKQKTRMLQSHLRARDEQIEGLQESLKEAQEQLKEKTTALSTPTKASKDDDSEKNIDRISPAPTAVLKELNKTRIQLAESERKYRQLNRKSEDWHNQSKLYIEEREKARKHEARVHQLELETRELAKKFEAAWATQKSWADFGVHLQNVLQLKVGTNRSIEKNDGAINAGPLEIITVQRGLDEMAGRTKLLEREKTDLQRQLETAQKRATTLEKQIQNETEAQSRSTITQKETEFHLEKAQRDLETLRAQEGIWKREAESLRNLLETCDQVGGTKQQLAKSDSREQSSFSVKALESSLQATRDEVRLLTEARDRLSGESESNRNECKDLQKELTRVTEKFGQLREALLKERAKAEEADIRAAKAEALAGKGSFNTDETRALHLQNNPFTEALKEKYQSQIDALQKRLEDAEKASGNSKTPGGTSLVSSSSAVRPDVDPQKLHKRLKESFKEQIGLFREGVYLMTGYKVDMLPNTERPTFRVRSMYAEQEQDHLLFVWPKAAGDDVVSLDLVETDQAKILSATDSYQYMTKFNSLPAFLASVQLSLFEKQTLVG